jgi:hypothetical protein
VVIRSGRMRRQQESVRAQNASGDYADRTAQHDE